MNENVEYLEVEEISSFNDLESFDKPYVVRGGCSDMPAVKKWNLDYLSDLFGDDNLSVEVYKERSDMEISNILKNIDIKFIDFTKKIKSKNPSYYLAQLSLKKYLNGDITIKDHNGGSYKNTILFIGNDCGSANHIHRFDDFFINQIIGDKTIFLYDYRKKYFGGHRKMSEIGSLTKKNFFRGNHIGKQIYKVLLNKGDSLYIPPWWWHATQSKGLSCSVTNIYKRDNKNYLVRYPKLLYFIIKEKIFLYYTIIKSIIKNDESDIIL